MATLGLTDLKSVLRVPGTLDLTYLRQFNGRDTAVEFDTLARQTAAAATIFNSNLLTGYWSRYVTVTNDIETPDDSGGSGTGLKKLAEMTRNAPVSDETTAHMLPMDDYGRSLVWTYWAIRRGNNGLLMRQVRLFSEDAQVSWDKALLNRLFKATYDAVGTGKSVPFADGGTADPDYSPPNYGGYTFDSSHTHYLRNADTAAGRDAYLSAAALHLRHHGITGPYDLVVPESDVDDFVALDGTQTGGAKWIKNRNGILETSNIEVRTRFENGEYLGAIETNRDTFLVATTNRLPANYAGVFKPMGLNSPFNPLKVRGESGYPLGITFVQEAQGNWPLQDIHGVFTFGVGIGNRLAGVPGYFAASGGYVSPTIS